MHRRDSGHESRRLPAAGPSRLHRDDRPKAGQVVHRGLAATRRRPCQCRAFFVARTERKQMETQSSNSPHPLMWLAGIALIVFCGAGVAAIMGWIPTSLGKPDEFPQGKVEQSPHKAVVAAQAPAPAKVVVAKAPVAPAAPVVVAAAKCAECGVIQSVREIETK